METRTRVVSVSIRARFGIALLVAAACLPVVNAQIPSQNVNMVAGQDLPGGDPFLQRQDEPSIAVSTRNPLHLLAGANDYRTVDLPGLPNGEVTGDAWLGVFKSIDGGSTWKSSLLPGYPQDPTHAAPLWGYQAAADPMVRSGSNGLFYYSGIVFNRTDPTPSAAFVARFIDNNNKENGDPIAFAGLQIVASNPGTSFIDKPALAVDIPRGKATCTIQTPGPNNTTLVQNVPAGMVYVAYTLGTGDEDDLDTFQSQIFLTASADCGVTWSAPLQISQPTDRINQGATLAIAPNNGTLHVAWRRFSADGIGDGIVTTRSTNLGKNFSPLEQIRKFPRGAVHTVNLRTFDQPTLENLAPLGPQFRTNGYPSLAIDGNGRQYVTWAERGFAPLAPDPATGDSRIVISTATPGGAWSAPQLVDNVAARGHQLMPALSFAAGRLMLVYYDLREDVSQAFQQYIRDFTGIPFRHTIDVRAAQALPGSSPVFDPSIKVSQYIFGEATGQTSGKVQLQFNVPNLPLFRRGKAPFIGDYIDVAGQAMLPTKNGWSFNTGKSAAPVFHATWTDNRDVHPPANGNWQDYTPPTSPFHLGGGVSVFDPTAISPACTSGQAGMRNQNIYGARITAGLLVAAPGNAKQLSSTLQRAFVVFAQNTTDVVKSFRLAILNQPTGGRASWSQFPLPPYTNSSPPPLVSIDAQIEPRSSISRTVFVTSSDPKAQISVSVTEITGLGGGVVTSGLTDTVILNPDVSNPDVSNPDVSNPNVINPDVSNAEVFTPDVSNPDVSNPDVSNPSILNPDVSNPDVSNALILNPDVSNPDVSNPDVSNPDVSNPDVSNPDVSNPDVSNASLTDVSWTITNNGNTTSAFSIKLVLNENTVPAGIITQLLVYRQYKTPVADACTLKFSTQNVLITNIPSPTFTAPGNVTQLNPADGSLKNATMYLGPFESARITIRVLDPNKNDTITFNPVDDVVPVVVSQAVDSPKTALGGTTPDVALPPGSGLPFFVVNTADSGSGSLRKAIQDNEASGGGSHIVFNIPGPGPYILTPQTPLPTATKPIVIDGTTQPGYAGVPIVRLDGSAAGAAANGLVLTGGSSGVRGFTIGGFDGHGIVLQNGGNNQIAANYIGTTPDGSAPYWGNATGIGGNGIQIEDSSNNVIGGTTGTTPGDSCTGDCNLLVSHSGAFGNTKVAVNIVGNGATSSANQILGNFFGVDVTGTVGLGGPFDFGVGILNAPNTAIGDGTPAGRNVISGYNTGVDSGGSGTMVTGNYIGTNAAGTAAIVNNFGGYNNVNFGVQVVGTNHSVDRNVLSGNGTGISCECNTSHVRGNLIGLNASGTAAIPNSWGLWVSGTAVNSTIGGVLASDRNVISGNNQYGIILSNNGVTGTQIIGNYIGTAPSGTTAIANGSDGVFVTGASGNFIGSATAGEGNVISGNGDAGIRIIDSSNNDVKGNFIGTDATGAVAIQNFLGGIRLDNATNITIGGAGGARNVVSGNGTRGIWLSAGPTGTVSGVQILGNYVGVAADGTTALGNQGQGIFLEQFGLATITNNTIGQVGAGNVISSNQSNGIWVEGGTNTVIRANLIGTDASGTAALGNVGNGVLLDGGDDTGTLVDNNTISANTTCGIFSNHQSSITITGNRVGTNAAGTAGLGNACGVFLGHTTNSIVGGTSGSERNIVGGSVGGGSGVWIYSDNAPSTGNQVLGNYIGVGADGTTAIPNTVGVIINGTGDNLANNTIGGAAAGSRNVISGNLLTGVEVSSSFANSNSVQGNYIGLNAAGTTAVPNGTGVLLRFGSSGTLIGGATAGLGNVISGNGARGLQILDSTGNTISGNFIGTNAAGTGAVGNVLDGVVYAAGADGNTLGGATAPERNVIAGNGAAGLFIAATPPVATNWVYGNYIGLSASGTPLGNAGAGVLLTGSNIAIGGPAAGQGNVISANGGDGVRVSGAAATNIAMPGNFIGTDPSGLTGMGNLGNGVTVTGGAGGNAIGNASVGSVISANAGYGVRIEGGSSNAINRDYIGTNSVGTSLGNGLAGISIVKGSNNNAVGGALSPGNVIAFNNGPGVSIAAEGGGDPFNNAILPNSIYGNVGIGIDLGADGPTANDGFDADGGPNGLQNWPHVNSATPASVTGEIFSAPNQTYTIRVYSSATANHEGRTFVTETTVTTDAAGHAVIGPLAVTLTVGDWVTMTAMDAAGNTSEFSDAVQVL